MAAKAEEHLENARFRRKFLTSEEKLLMLPAVAVDRFLTRLNKADCNVFHPDLTKRDSWCQCLKTFFDSLLKPWGLYYKTFYGRNLRIFVIS
jgi:hypothetical protein